MQCCDGHVLVLLPNSQCLHCEISIGLIQLKVDCFSCSLVSSCSLAWSSSWLCHFKVPLFIRGTTSTNVWHFLPTKNRSRGNVDVTTRRWLKAETLASRGTYRLAIQRRAAARRALEWIGVSKARLVFRYEISDLFLKAQTTQQQIKFQQCNEYLASQ